MYIGRTISPKRRWNEHKATAFNDGKIECRSVAEKAIRKYGIQNFEFRVFQICSSLKEMLAAEVYWTAFYKTNIIRYGDEFGYNLSDGGDGGGYGPKSQTHKNNISKSKIGKKKPKNMCLKLSKAKSQFSIQELNKIKKLLLDDRNISTYKIAAMFNCTQSTISEMKLGKSHLYFFTPSDIEQFKLRKIDKGGERNAAAKLNEIQIKEIKILLVDGVSVKELAVKYNVGKSTIRRIKDGKSWGHVK